MQHKNEVGHPIGKWTEERIRIALDHLHNGLSLTRAAKKMGISRMALTNALERHGVKPRRIWI